MTSIAPTPAAQARKDAERSKANKVRTLADMSPEEREKLLNELNSADRSRAKSRAEQAKRGKR